MRLCLAFCGQAKLRLREEMQIRGVLRAARRYSLIVQRSSSMTATVVEDIEARGLDDPWGRLGIVANCY
ncbi:hypothetical protein B0I35DRAFT_440565 [Stachybotrys elegans]|uniref:Uncharacterized protein n=1 Tax=Stachybotrys elegans TaxID=80388 RepID=A0A8K0SHY0_9HYPO|nr:hypothetical protein B0I35DRAFT_440565 [Stachybotrys elegans]